MKLWKCTFAILAILALPTGVQAALNAVEGQQWDYVTTSEITNTGPTSGTVTVEVTSSYTVVSKENDLLTIYTSAEIFDKNEPNALLPRPRFTFEMNADGYRTGREAGPVTQALPAWSSHIAFLPGAEAGKQRPVIALPLLGREVPTDVTSSTANGKLLVKLTIDEEAKKQIADATIERCEWDYEVAAATGFVTQSKVHFEAKAMDPTGRPIQIKIAHTSRLTNSKILPAAEIKSLKADVQDGVGTYERLKANMSETRNFDAGIESLQKYLASYPNGQLATVFQEIITQLKHGKEVEERMAKLKPGAPAPDFTATSLDGKTIKLADYRGKVVVLSFWATWCAPCVAKAPALVNFYKEHKGTPLEIISISADQSSDPVVKFTKSRGMTWPQIHQDVSDETSVLRTYGVTTFPTLILVDKEGVIKNVTDSLAEVQGQVAELLEAGAKPSN